MTKQLSIAFFFLLITGSLQAQEYKINSSSEITISGTSSLHDWTMSAEDVKGTGTFYIEDNQLKDIKDLQVTIKAESLKSGKSGMDKNAYKALNTDKYKNINFVLTNVKEVRKSGSKYKVLADGNLTISGVTRKVSINTDCTVENGKIVCTGAVPLKMTDFNVEPPTAMFGTITTGDAIMVNFKTTFNK